MVPRRGARAGRATSEHVGQVGAARGERRREAREQHGEERRDGRERRGAEIERIVDPVDVGQEEGPHGEPAPANHQQRERAAQDRQHTRFEQELSHQPAAADPERQPHRDLAMAAGAAREQEVRDVGARDEQHQQRDHREPFGHLRAFGRVGALADGDRMHAEGAVHPVAVGIARDRVAIGRP